jgi:hypothetical protein
MTDWLDHGNSWRHIDFGAEKLHSEAPCIRAFYAYSGGNTRTAVQKAIRNSKQK